MVKGSKDKNFRTYSSKENRQNRRGQSGLQSASSQPKSIQQMIKQNDQNIIDLKNRRNFLIEELEQTKEKQKQSQFKEIIISECERQIKMIQKAIYAALINSQKLTKMWIAQYTTISNVVLEFQHQIKKKTQKKKHNIASKMKKFASEDQRQE